MDLKLVRLKDDGQRTIGVLSLDGRLVGWTLEDAWRNNQPNVSCIPLGDYRVIMSHSPKFKRRLPEVLGVPDRTYIRIHPGNTEGDTEGCILVGLTLSPDQTKVLDSQAAISYLNVMLDAADEIGQEIRLSVVNSL